MMRILITLLILRFSVLGYAQKKVVLNDYNKKGVEFFIGLEKPKESFTYLQAAQRFKCESPSVILQKINLQRLILWVNQGPSNTRDASNTVTFKLRFYDVDSITGGPGRDLCQEKIEVKNGKDETVAIDVSKFKIVVPGKEFFIAIEWIRIESNMRTVDRFKAVQIPGDLIVRTGASVYQPFIGMINTGAKVSSSWVLTHENEWKLYTHNMPEMTDLAISAEVILK